MQMNKRIQPMPLLMSISFFASISLILAFGIHVLVPYGNQYGIPAFYTYMGTLLFASIIGIVLSLTMYFLEKRQGLLKDTSFKERFWIRKLSISDFIWGIGLLVFWVLTLTIIKGIFLKHIEMPFYLISEKGTIYGVPIQGNYGLIIFEALFLFINITGEELFLRGYMLPRQVLRHGKRAWVVNGVLWALFHIPIYWIAPALAPGCIALAYVTQKRRSIWPAIIAHFLLNGTDTVMTLVF